MANNPIDQHVGKRLRDRRTLLGLTQQQLAEMLGVTFQQLQKYEKGANRIGSSRLYDLCNALDVEANYFFEEIPREVARLSPAKTKGFTAAEMATNVEMKSQFARRETIELVRAYFGLSDPAMRKKFLDLIRATQDIANKGS